MICHTNAYDGELSQRKKDRSVVVTFVYFIVLSTHKGLIWGPNIVLHLTLKRNLNQRSFSVMIGAITVTVCVMQSKDCSVGYHSSQQQPIINSNVKNVCDECIMYAFMQP